MGVKIPRLKKWCPGRVISLACVKIDYQVFLVSIELNLVCSILLFDKLANQLPIKNKDM